MKTKAIIDAVTTGVNGLALPTHQTFKYYRPLSLSGPNGALVPALAVSPARDAPNLLDTSEGYEIKHHLMVTWYAGQMAAMNAGLADEPVAAATLDHVSLIVDLLASWADAVPGLAFQSEVGLGDVHFGHIEGGIWAVEINLFVRVWEM